MSFAIQAIQLNFYFEPILGLFLFFILLDREKPRMN